MDRTIEEALKNAETAKAIDESNLMARLHTGYVNLKRQIHKVIVGQDEIIDSVLCCMLSGGHCIVQGVPGLAKTLLVHSISDALKLKFNRIQFTPDLMPSDITGTDIIQEDPESRHRRYEFVKGPIFANVILADEINRTPPKTQAALLQAMQEREVTVAGRTYKLDEPFFVLATENPIEQEGTYPLPEAALDRFMFMIYMDYPTAKEEYLIVKQTTTTKKQTIKRVLTRDDMVLFQGAKARALIKGRITPSLDDVKTVSKLVLRHRIIPNFDAEADEVTVEQILDDLLEEVTLPK